MSSPPRPRSTPRRLAVLLVVAVLASVLWMLSDGSSPPDSGGDLVRGPSSSSRPLDPGGSLPSLAPDLPQQPSAPAALMAPVEVASAPPPQPIRQYARRVALPVDGSPLRGRVLHADGTPVPGAVVSAYSESWNDYHGQSVHLHGTDTTDAAGRYELKLAATGGWADMRLGVLVDGRRRFLGRVVPAGGSGDIVLDDAADVVVRLMFDDGTPVSDARVLDGHPVMNVSDAAPDIRALWTLGATDADGRVALPVTDDMELLRTRIEHPEVGREERRALDLAVWREAHALSAEPGVPDGVVEWVFPRLACLELALEGDHAAWNYRGSGPRPLLFVLAEAPDGSLAPSGNDLWYLMNDVSFLRSPDPAEQLFVYARLPPGPVQLKLELFDVGRKQKHRVILTEHVDLPPGTTRLALPLPDLPAYEPGDWWTLPVELVDPAGLLLDENHPDPPVIMPRLIATGRDGKTSRDRVDARLGKAWMNTTLVPPVRLGFADFPDAPSIDGLEPGDRARLVWDRDALAASFGTLSVTLPSGEPLGRARPAIDLSPGVGPGSSNRFALPVEVEIPAGAWTWKIVGSWTEGDEGAFELSPGGRVELSATLTPGRMRAKTPSGTVTGTITVLSDDPWVVPADVRSEPLSVPGEGAVHEVRVTHGAYWMAGLAPGTHRLTATVTRCPEPEVTASTQPDVSHWPVPKQAVTSRTREVTVTLGETTVVDFEIDARGQLGVVLLELPPTGLVAPYAEWEFVDRSGNRSTWRDEWVQLTLRDAEGVVVKERRVGDWPAAGISHALPAGDYTVELRAAYPTRAENEARLSLGHEPTLPPPSWTGSAAFTISGDEVQPLRIPLTRRWWTDAVDEPGENAAPPR